MEVTGLVQTCPASPSQWEGYCDDRPVYIRYRFGNLTVSVGEVGDRIPDADEDPNFGRISTAVGGICVLDVSYGDDYDGVMEEGMMLSFVQMINLPSAIERVVAASAFMDETSIWAFRRYQDEANKQERPDG